MKITFVTYEVSVSPETMGKVLSLEPLFFRYQSYELIKALFSSARYFHPYCRTVILTDQTTSFPELPKDIEIHRFDLDTRQLTRSRTQAQLEFAKIYKDQSHLIFLDSDMLIQSSLEELFQAPFDIGLSYRKHNMPINGGLILMHGLYRQAGISFMSRVLDSIQNDFPTFQIWYGSQHALKNLVEIPENIENEKVIVEQNGKRILLIPSSKYNFTTQGPMVEPYPDKAILHFKGSRKIFMLPYFEKYLAEKHKQDRQD